MRGSALVDGWGVYLEGRKWMKEVLELTMRTLVSVGRCRQVRSVECIDSVFQRGKLVSNSIEKRENLDGSRVNQVSHMFKLRRRENLSLRGRRRYTRCTNRIDLQSLTLPAYRGEAGDQSANEAESAPSSSSAGGSSSSSSGGGGSSSSSNWNQGAESSSSNWNSGSAGTTSAGFESWLDWSPGAGGSSGAGATSGSYRKSDSAGAAASSSSGAWSSSAASSDTWNSSSSSAGSRETKRSRRGS